MKYLRVVLGLVLAGSLFASSANADIITYSLSDKGFGMQNPPDYGVRLDDLFGVPDSEWTFSFNSTDVQMVIDTTLATAHIFGDVIGGENVGIAWGTVYDWNLDFTYTDITIIDPATGYWHAADVGMPTHINLLNIGTLTLLSPANVDGVAGLDNGKSVALADYMSGDFFLHPIKGPYVSAWLASTPGFYAGADPPYEVSGCCKDFGFKATRVPEPHTLSLFGVGLLGLGFMRRKRAT